MTRTSVNEALKNFFKTTTLHGFKYLYAKHYVDRVGWVFCCFASAGCAGVLCSVLWARFQDVPAVLALSNDIHKTNVEDHVPAIAICASTEQIANVIEEKLTTQTQNKSLNNQLSNTLAILLSGHTANEQQLIVLEKFLQENDLTLPQAIMKYTLNCNEQAKRCRYQRVMVDCERLFRKELTPLGVCCVMRPERLSNLSSAHFFYTHMLDLVLQCGNGSRILGCKLITLNNEVTLNAPDNPESEILLPGYFYMAQLRYSIIPENPCSDPIASTDNTCVPDMKYSRSQCKQKCGEKTCGCQDPLYVHNEDSAPNHALLICPLSKISCLRNETNRSCHCLRSCQKITTLLVLESNPLNAIENSVDPLYVGINVTLSMVLYLRVNVGLSQIFVLNPTESWLTLLSSLGGVFNMFLGVGVFSVLELFYFIFVKLPSAVRLMSEFDHIHYPS